jgi:nucleoside-diphosphate-sugar epimerase
MNVLITGATGFVGSNLIPYLNASMAGARIVVLVRKGAGFEYELLWDELKASDLKSIDAIIHLAGKAHDTKNTSVEAEYFHINYELTRKLYDLFLRSEVKKFIYLSSVKAAADSVDGVLREDHHPHPGTAYGRSKLKAEEYILDSILTAGSDKTSYILRPCMIHGPRNKGNLNLLYKFARLGIPYPLAAFENKRSFLSVSNLCFVIKELLEQPIKSGLYQISDDEPVSTNELITIISQVQGRGPRLWRVSRFLIKAVARGGDFLKLPLNSESLRKLTENYVVSNQKILAALKLNTMPLSAREGLERTIKSLMQSKNRLKS